MIDDTDTSQIAGFWRRIFALIIDVTILGLIGLLLGLAFSSQFIKMGDWALLVGVIISFTYFGLMNSKLCHGQTIGKKFLQIRVVNSNNESISTAKSYLRYAIFSLPVYLNGNPIFSTTNQYSYLTYLLSMIIIGMLMSTIYLYIFNRSTRQSLHDVLSGTFVVNASSEKNITKKTWKPHFVLIGILFIGGLFYPILFDRYLGEPTLNGMMAAQKELMKDTDVKYASIISSTNTIANEENKKHTSLTASINLKTQNIKDEDLAEKYGRITVKSYPDAVKHDRIHIVLNQGYDIGIWSHWNQHTHSFKPNQLISPDKEK